MLKLSGQAVLTDAVPSPPNTTVISKNHSTMKPLCGQRTPYHSHGHQDILNYHNTLQFFCHDTTVSLLISSWHHHNITTRAGPAEKRRKLPKVVPRNPLKIGLQKLEAITLTHQWLCEKKKRVRKILTFFFRLDLAEISAKTQKHQLFDTKFVWKLSFSITMKFGGDRAEETRRRSM